MVPLRLGILDLPEMCQKYDDSHKGTNSVHVCSHYPKDLNWLTMSPFWPGMIWTPSGSVTTPGGPGGPTMLSPGGPGAPGKPLVPCKPCNEDVLASPATRFEVSSSVWLFGPLVLHEHSIPIFAGTMSNLRVRLEYRSLP